MPSKTENLSADICIIGAGPAGLTLAQRLKSSGQTVLLLEAGAYEDLPAIRDDLAGECTADYYDLRDNRMHGIGGSARRWDATGARWRALDRVDLDQWPIDYEELEPYYREMFRLVERADPGRRPLSPNTEAVGFCFVDRSFWTTTARQLEAHPNIRIETEAVVTELLRGANSQAVSVAQLADGRRIEATAFIIAGGCLESARLLLLSQIGNHSDWVGRCFMEHPHPIIGWLDQPEWSGKQLKPFFYHEEQGNLTEQCLRLTDDCIRREGLLNSHYWLRYRPAFFNRASPYFLRQWSKLIDLLDYKPSKLKRKLYQEAWAASFTRRRTKHAHRGRILVSANIEHRPDPNSRLTLSNKRDRFGRPRIRLDWRWSLVDLESVRHTIAIMDRELFSKGLGRWRWNHETMTSKRKLWFGNHLLGTTRMSRDPAEGVVAPSCRVHDMENVYVIGASVFPTGAVANPTLSVCSLALRLADHLADQLHATGRMQRSSPPEIIVTRS